jgi:hypothetical protein
MTSNSQDRPTSSANRTQDHPADTTAANAAGHTNRRQFFAGFAGIGVKLAALGSVWSSASGRSEAEPAVPPPPALSESEERAASVARFQRNQELPIGAAGRVSIYRYDRTGRSVDVEEGQSGCGATSEGEVSRSESGRSVWGIDAEGHLVSYHDAE